MQTLGDRVKAEREARDWTQAELARRVVRAGFPSMSQGGIGQIERRGATEPKCVVQLAAALGVSAKWLQTGHGDKHAGALPPPTKLEVVEIPVRSYVGAGDEIFPVEGDAPIDYVPAPPGMENAEATEVRGRSMLPLYHQGDLLFHRRIEHTEIARFRDQVVVVQLRGGRRLVKVLQPGSKRGRYTLTSINPAFAPIEDQQVEWIGPIEWVHKRWRL